MLEVRNQMLFFNAIMANVAWTWILGSVLILLAAAIAIAVAMQSSQDKNLSGTIAGGAETFFGKSKSTTRDRFLARFTIVASIIFVIVAAVLVILLKSTTL